MANLSMITRTLVAGTFFITTLLLTQPTSACYAKNRCESVFVSLVDVVENYALYRHMIRTVKTNTAEECYKKCKIDCSCQTFQLYQNTDCELLYEDRHSAPQDFKPRLGYRYYQLKREYKSQCPATKHSCNDPTCFNKCCGSSPCLNGGTCTELCEDPRAKLNCTCPQGYVGKFCGTKIKSCKDYLTAEPSSKSGQYFILDSTNQPYRTYCDFGSEARMAWTLIESFALSNNAQHNKGFSVDNAINEASFNWPSFRLSLDHMKGLYNQSTHFRATCNFSPSGAVNYFDYLRVKTSELNLLTVLPFKCTTFELLSIRGYKCDNCVFGFWQSSESHIHIDSHLSPTSCSTSFSVPGSLGGNGEDNFGLYLVQNSAHGCSSSPSATTQWWIGTIV